MKRGLRGLATAALLAGAAGCGAPRLVRREHPWPAAECALRDGAHEIACDGREVARVVCHSERHEGFKCRDLSVRYADGEVAWLHRAGPAIPAPYPPDKVDLEAAYGPVVARDGRTIWFRTRTPSTDWRTHAYDVATGVLRDEDAARERAEVEAGRAVPLGVTPGAGR